jgi:6-pyruvoyltetrahydropterin/6-carboxytetrahydropterin synthase
MARAPNILFGLQVPSRPPADTWAPTSVSRVGALFFWLQEDRRVPSCVVARRVHFNAAHRLHNPRQSDEWNRNTFGKCNLPNYHGHNYELDILVEGEIDPDTGYVIDVGVLKQLADEHLIAVLDHRNLNLDVPWFAERLPSAENIARFCWEQLAPRIPHGRLTRIRLWETPRNYVDYEGH